MKAKLNVKLLPGLKKWSKDGGKTKDIRVLLSSVQNVLWKGVEWENISLGEILEDRKLKVS